MNRLDFIKNTGLGLLGAFVSPEFLARKEIVFGHNGKTYKMNRKWSQADVSRFPVNDCHEMVQDQKGRILLLTNDTRNNILVYDRSGKILESWGTEYPGAHGLTLFDENGEEVLFICDNSRHQVIKTTLSGKVLMTLDYPKEINEYTRPEEYIPTETAIAPNGDIYVADGYGKDLIIQYNAKGEYIRHFGGKGTGEQHLNNAHGICLDTRDPKNVCLIVTSRQANAFKRFDLEGNYLSTIELPGAWVCRPVIKGDYLYAAVLQSESRKWEASGFVTILDKNNQVISNIAGCAPVYKNGKPEEMYQTIKAFQYPHDVCVDTDENLYIAQWNSGKIYPVRMEPV